MTKSSLPRSGPKIVAIGGGTGLSTMLRGLKKKTANLTAIVAVSDNGGGSGVLREELGMLPPGDVRNCIQALANTEPTMEKLLAYRFTEGHLKGQSLGNLFLAALNGMTGSFDQAVEQMSEVLAITGRVLPVTNANIHLVADFDDGSTVTGQVQIARYKRESDSGIRQISVVPAHPKALPACLDAIAEADLILLGPGSLYTSVIPNLLVDGICEAIHASKAMKAYIMNIMTQDGETEGYSGQAHVQALFDHGGTGLFDHCLINSREIPQNMLEAYHLEGASPTQVDTKALEAMGITSYYAPVARWANGLVRHDPDDLAQAIMEMYLQLSPVKVYSKK